MKKIYTTLFLTLLTFTAFSQDCQTFESFDTPGEIDPGATQTADCQAAPNFYGVALPFLGAVGVDILIDEVMIDISHTFSGDITLRLEDQDGNSIFLAETLAGAIDDAYNGTIFQDGGGDITTASAPFGVGPYAASGGNFNDIFDGVFIDDDTVWNLIICDISGDDTGTVNGFSITFCEIEDAPPPNDMIANAIDVDQIGFPYTDPAVNTPLATTENGIPSGCNITGAPGVWYKFTAASDGTATGQIVSTAGTFGVDFYMAPNESAIETDLVFVSQASNMCGPGDAQSTIDTEAGVTYYFFAVNTGSPTDITINSEATPPPNDMIANAIDVDEIGFPYTDPAVNTPLATTENGIPSGCNITGAPGVWYKFTAVSDGTATGQIVSTAGTFGVDFYMAPNESAIETDLVFVSQASNMCGPGDAQSTIDTEAGVTYYFFAVNTGSPTDITINSEATPPPNDMIANAIDVDQIGFPYTDPAVNTPLATTENGTPSGCNITGAPGVWYKFTAVSDGTATGQIVSTAGTFGVDFYMAPNESAIETDLVFVSQASNMCGPGDAQSTIDTEAGVTYYFFAVNTGSPTDIEITGNTLSVTDNILSNISLYPNPASDMVQFTKQIDGYEVYNLLGQKVLSGTEQFIDVQNLNEGMYLVKVTKDGAVGTERLIVKH